MKYESAELLTIVRNLSLKMSFVKEELKMANVIQIFKSALENYKMESLYLHSGNC